MVMVDIFNEKYVHITGKALGFDDIQIFAKKRGNYIFRVSLVPAFFREDEGDVYDAPFIRYMIIEIGKDDQGDTVVKDYVFFDLALPDDDMMERLKSRIAESAEESLVNMMLEREGLTSDDRLVGFKASKSYSSVSESNSSNDIGYF